MIGGGSTSRWRTAKEGCKTNTFGVFCSSAVAEEEHGLRMAVMLSQLASFARTVLSPPAKPPKRAAFFEEDGSLTKRASYHAEDLSPHTPLRVSPVVGTPNSTHVPVISPVKDSPQPFDLPALSFSPAPARRKRRLSGPLEEHVRFTVPRDTD